MKTSPITELYEDTKSKLKQTAPTERSDGGAEQNTRHHVVHFNTHKDIKRMPSNPKFRLSEKSEVVEGQAMPLSSIVFKLKQGMPVQATNRQVESYYKNLDLVDIEKMSTEYKQLNQKLMESKIQFENHKKELKNQEKMEIENLKKQINELATSTIKTSVNDKTPI